MSFLKDRVEIKIEEAELGGQKAFLGLPPKVKQWLTILAIALIPGFFLAQFVAQRAWLKEYALNPFFAKPSFTNPQTPNVSGIQVLSLAPQTYAALAQISNPNLELSFDNVTYEFNFYNQLKEKIYTHTDQLFLLPNQTKYVIAPRFASPEPIAYAELKLPENLPWQKRLSIPRVQIDASVPKPYQQFSPAAYVVEGDFTNKSPYTLKRVRLTFVLFDALDKVTGVSQRDEFTVTPFERRGYKQLWPGAFPLNSSRVEIFADTDTLDSSNLTASETQISPAGDLGRPSERE